MPDLLPMSRHERFARALGDVQGVMKFSPSSSHRDGIAIFVLEDDAALREDPTYVAARAILDDVDRFDAAFFGMHAREAELRDP